MKANPARNKSLEELKLDFILSVYDTITKQIQAMDLKISILLSWNGVIAVMLGREIGSYFSATTVNLFTMVCIILSVAGLVASAFFIWGVLKPRVGKMENHFTGLLFSEDILRLASTPGRRMDVFMNQLIAIKSPEEIFQQFSKSIVLISEIHHKKNKLFNRGLTSTALSFLILALLITLHGLKIQ